MKRSVFWKRAGSDKADGWHEHAVTSATDCFTTLDGIEQIESDTALSLSHHEETEESS